MKKLIVKLMIIAFILLMGGSLPAAQSQNPADEEKPTFYRLTPGVYVNGWPRFTIYYPKDWVEKKPSISEIFRVASPNPLNIERFIINVCHEPQPLTLDNLADSLLLFWKNVAKEVTVVSAKTSRLRDGTPAREVELQMVLNNLPFNYFGVSTRKGDMEIGTGVVSNRGRIRENLKAILYSLEFEPGKDGPVNLPPDVQGFLDAWCNDMVSHDVAKVSTHFSDRFLESGDRKQGVEQFWGQIISRVTSVEVGITEFVSAGDKAYLAGFITSRWGKAMLRGTSIIKENGEWKWYGNQRDPAP
jgi:hypothetical protein